MNFLEPDYEAGPTHPLALKRTFGSTEPIRVKLYRCVNGAPAAGLHGVCLLSQLHTFFYTCTPCGGPRMQGLHTSKGAMHASRDHSSDLLPLCKPATRLLVASPGCTCS